MSKQFLYDYQYEAVNNMKNGCILNGGVGSGKSRTALYYYFKENFKVNSDDQNFIFKIVNQKAILKKNNNTQFMLFVINF